MEITLIQALIFVVLIWFVFSRIMPVKGVENITASEAKKKIKDKNVQFIDVRTPGEYAAYHRKPFVNIPLSHLAREVDRLDKEKEVVVICQSGMRSMRAAKILKKKGFEKVTNVRGGISLWG